MMADTYNCPVKTVQNKEGPALGAAILAGVGAGVYGSVQEGCKKVISCNPPQSPILENVKEYEKYYQMYKQLYPVLKPLYKNLADL